MAVTLTSDEISSYKGILLGLLPLTGAPIGNINARRQLRERIEKEPGRTITDDDYWAIRRALWEDGAIGIGGGKGGSLYILTQPSEAAPDTKYNKEPDLYDPILRTINASWREDFFIEDFVSQVTAFGFGGGRDTGGQWTRPDLILVAVRIYPFIPGKSIEIFSFEVKLLNPYVVQGVFETASHSAFAHRSYFMLYVPPGFDDRTVLDRLDAESERFGVGFYTFEDPEDWGSYDLRVNPQPKNPSPFTINDFLTRQLSATNKTTLEKLIK